MLAYLLIRLCDLYSTIIFIYVLLSWFPTSTGWLADVYRVLGKICDPYLDLFKKLIPPIGGMVDITPIIALIILQSVPRFLISVL